MRNSEYRPASLTVIFTCTVDRRGGLQHRVARWKCSFAGTSSRIGYFKYGIIRAWNWTQENSLCRTNIPIADRIILYINRAHISKIYSSTSRKLICVKMTAHPVVRWEHRVCRQITASYGFYTTSSYVEGTASCVGTASYVLITPCVFTDFLLFSASSLWCLI